MKYTNSQYIAIIDSFIQDKTDYDVNDFTGGSLGITLTYNKTIVKYKFTMYFGFTSSKNAISKVVDIDEKLYHILNKALEVKVKSSINDDSTISLDYLNDIITNGSTNIDTKESNTPTKTKTNTLFTFVLSTNKLLSNCSQEYRDKLKEYIESSGKSMSYEDFYNSCEMKPYKYKNFKLAYDKWNKDDKPKGATGLNNVNQDYSQDMIGEF